MQRPPPAQPESKTSEGQAALAPDVLGQLQAAIIDALCSGTPLAGQDRPLNLPDFAQLVKQPQVILCSDNLGGPINLKHRGAAPLHILSQRAIHERAQRQGPLYFLRFESPQPLAKGVRLTLQLQTAQPGATRGPNLGMSATQVSFEHTGQGWRALDDTAELSA